jgi:hypothetical protein
MRTSLLAKLLTTSALTAALLGGPAHAASASSNPDGGDFIVDCPQPSYINIEENTASGGGMIIQPTCSRDTIVRK